MTPVLFAHHVVLIELAQDKDFLSWNWEFGWAWVTEKQGENFGGLIEDFKSNQ